MYLVWLTALVLGSGFAISGGPKRKGKLLNVAIILGCMALGFGIGYAAGLGSGNMGSIPDAGVPFSMMFGIVAAFGCICLNNWRQNYDDALIDNVDAQHATAQQQMRTPPNQTPM
jgi:hypothetical protein